MSWSSVACIVKKDNKYLFCKREDNGLWVLPGGAIEAGEDPAKAAIRELFEETGLRAEKVRLRAGWRFDLVTERGLVSVFEAVGDVMGKLKPSWETPQVAFLTLEQKETPLPKYVKNLIKSVETTQDFLEINAGPFEFYVAIRFIYGKIKRKIRKIFRGF